VFSSAVRPHFASGHRASSGHVAQRLELLSVGRNRETGTAHLRFRDDRGRLVAARLRPRQFRTLANAVLGLAEAMEERA
jgi:hypothetical protein